MSWQQCEWISGPQLRQYWNEYMRRQCQCGKVASKKKRGLSFSRYVRYLHVQFHSRKFYLFPFLVILLHKFIFICWQFWQTTTKQKKIIASSSVKLNFSTFFYHQVYFISIAICQLPRLQFVSKSFFWLHIFK